MTARDPNDLRDARVDAAWRAVSREEPPAALDDAIRAAARREIGAGPRSADAREPPRPSRCAPSAGGGRSPPRRRSARSRSASCSSQSRTASASRAADKAVVSDMPAAPASTQEAGGPCQAPPSPQRGAGGREARDSGPCRNATTAERRARTYRAGPDPTHAAAPARCARTRPLPLARDEGAGDARRRETVRRRAERRPRMPPRLRRRSREPFPADAAKRESKEAAMRDAAHGRGDASPAPPAAAVCRIAGVRRRRRQAGARRRPRQAQRAKRKRGPLRRRTARRVARRKPTTPAESQPPLPRRRWRASVVARESRGAKLSVPDWIALIRKLRDEGRTDEAAKELAAFRDAYADHEQLLPPDLRDWKPRASARERSSTSVARRCSARIGAGSAAASASSRVSHTRPGRFRARRPRAHARRAAAGSSGGNA